MWPVLQRSNRSRSRGENYEFCSLCGVHVSVAHGGKDDCRKHVETKKHRELGSSVGKTKPLTDFFGKQTTDNSVINADFLFTQFIVEHNLPLAVSDHAGKLFEKMFPDSKIAKQYSCARSKTTALVNELSIMTKEIILENIKHKPFSIATDGSNDSDYKQYPIIVRYFSEETGKIMSSVLAVPTCDGSATGENIFALINNVVQSNAVPYCNMLSLGCDNANVMVGKKKGVFGFLLKMHESIYCAGCPCHLIHLAAEKASVKLECRVDEVLIDIFYYLEKSAKRKDTVKNLQSFHGVDQHKILRHVCTRWLSLGKCLNRLLEQWQPLKEFFKADLSERRDRERKKKEREEKKNHQSKAGQKSDTSSVKTDHSKSKTVKSSSNSDHKINDESRRSTSSCEKTQAKTASWPKVRTGHPSFTDAIYVVEKSVDRVVSKIGDRSAETGCASESRNSKEKDKRKATDQGRKTERKQGNFQSTDRLERVCAALTSNVFLLQCLFLSFTIPVFDEANLLLQSDKPLIHKTRMILTDLFRKILVRFIKPNVIKQSESSVLKVKFEDKSSHRDDDELIIGSRAREFIRTNKTEPTPSVLKGFFDGVKAFFIAACNYMKDKFPFSEELLEKAEVCNIELRDSVTFSHVQYFTNRFSSISVNVNCDALELEFAEYQSMTIPKEVLEEERVDVQWTLISRLKDANGNKKFCYLPFVMFSVMSIPHSNAECERVFSFVRKNHNVFRSNIGPTTAESLMVMKADTNPCYSRTCSAKGLKRFKSCYSLSLKND